VPAPAQPIYHTVRVGDNLTSIAARYGVSVQAIAQANGISNVNLIRIGRALIIPVQGYVVQPGDSLGAIALRTGTTVWALARANGVWNVNLIRVGQILAIPAGGTVSGSTKPLRIYVVRSGDTLTAIAYHYNTTVQAVAQANNLFSPHLIYIGQTLYIP